MRALLSQLDGLKTIDGKFLKAFASDYNVDTDVINRVELKDCVAGETTFARIRSELCNELSQQMHARFDPLLDDPVLRAARAFDQSLWPHDIASLLEYGQSDIKFLTEHFSDVLKTLNVDTDKSETDWARLKVHISEAPTLMSMPYQELYYRLFDSESDPRDPLQFYDVLVLVLLVQLIAMDTSICERIFSLLNRLQTKVRNRMGLKLLQMSMTIIMLGHEWKDDISSVPCAEIIAIWREGVKTKRYDAKIWSQDAVVAFDAIVTADVVDLNEFGVEIPTVPATATDIA